MMRRFSLAASGLGMAALVSIALANPPAETIVANGKDADLLRARVGPPAEGLEVETAVEGDATLREEHLKLMVEKAALEKALGEARRDFYLLEAETQFDQALRLLTRVSEVYRGSQPAEKATQLLECWKGIEQQTAGAKAAEEKRALSPEEAARPALIEFSEVVVNLDDGRLNRYLDVEIYLKVTKGEHDRIAELVASNKIPMLDWLLSYLSAQDLEDVRGPDNHDRLRNEIRDGFNALLFPNGDGGIDKVLFKKFAVQ